MANLIALAILWVLIFIFFLIFITIFLKIGLGFVDSDKREFGQVFATAFLCTLIMWLLIFFLPNTFLWLVIAILIGLLICWAVIAARHKIGFGSAIFVTIIAVIAAVVIIIILIIVISTLIGIVIWVF